jgi:hypothetical protein
MFLDDLGLGFISALVLVVPITGITMIGAKKESFGWMAVVGVVLIIAYMIINLIMFWWGQPIYGFSRIAFNHEYWRIGWAILITAVIMGVTAVAAADDGGELPTYGSWFLAVIVVVGFFYGWNQQFIWTGGRAKTLAHQVYVTNEPVGSYPDTNPNNIRQVSEQSADYYASQVVSSNPKYSTDWQIKGGVLQSVNNHLYYIYQLYPTGFSNSHKLPNSADPGYVVVDAQNPGNRWLRTTDASGHKIRMIDYMGGYHAHALGRFLWAHGYRDQKVSDLTLEVNNQWQPYYTAAVGKPTVNFNHDVPRAALVINPQNGKMVQYPIKDGYPQGLPDWVDRIYSSQDVQNMLNWWGEWANAPYGLFHESSNNRFKVVGTPTLVYADTDHPVWQVQMTSYSSDKGVAYLMLFDGRDDHVRKYQIPDLVQDNQAESTIEGISSNSKNLSAVNLTLYKIYGQLTWVASMVCNQDAGFQACAQQGMAMLPNSSQSGSDVATAATLSKTLQNYQQVLTSQSSGTSVNQNAISTSVSGVVSRLNEVDVNGYTVWYFMLAGDNAHVYSASLQNASSAVNISLPFIAVGKKVTFSYLNTKEQVRTVDSNTAFNVQGLSLSSNG